MKELFTVPEVAAELGISRQRVLQRLNDGSMKGERVSSKLWVVRAEEVERWKEIGRLPAGRPRKAPPLDPRLHEYRQGPVTILIAGREVGHAELCKSWPQSDRFGERVELFGLTWTATFETVPGRVEECALAFEDGAALRGWCSPSVDPPRVGFTRVPYYERKAGRSPKQVENEGPTE